ncbi:hypothetical protein [Sphingomonas sediminicola]|uniref:hypothetical protein n=1 Tax=Sphingomonas sediminicola TaxID=386874 RepID=UPI001CA66861|nr:hypothetical protein [Sphingomonas sediminicola]
MRILFALPGLHRFGRGAEVVFESIAQQIAAAGNHQVTLVGSGEVRPGRAYDFVHVPLFRESGSSTGRSFRSSGTSSCTRN